MMDALIDSFLSDPRVLLGMLMGAVLVGFFCWLGWSSREGTLLRLARSGGCEKLRDGQFYYLVHESEYNELTQLRLRVRQAQIRQEQEQAAQELDVNGVPKTKLTLMEQRAVETLNLVKAWAESDRAAPFPEEAHMGADLVLGLAQLRRRGVR